MNPNRQSMDARSPPELFEFGIIFGNSPIYRFISTYLTYIAKTQKLGQSRETFLEESEGGSPGGIPRLSLLFV